MSCYTCRKLICLPIKNLYLIFECTWVRTWKGKGTNFLGTVTGLDGTDASLSLVTLENNRDDEYRVKDKLAWWRTQPPNPKT